MSPKIKMSNQSINILAVSFFIATCLLMTKYNSQNPSTFVNSSQNRKDEAFINKNFEEGEKSEKDPKSKMENLFSAATSGKEFSGDRIRTFPKNHRKFAGTNLKWNNRVMKMSSPRNCTKWAVVTTIFSPPQESVRRFLYRLDWCIVIVGDKSKPQVCI